MANVKELQTRIALKYDTWANWNDETVDGQGAKLVLLKGEIGLCEIPSGNSAATTAPTVLFKVGDGEHTFKELQWASALAADVYDWAKASDVVLEGKSIKFVAGTGDDRKVVKEIAIPYVTEAEVKAITDPLDARIAEIEATLGTEGTTGSVSARLADAEDKLDDILGHEASEGVEAKVGLIDQAEKAAKDYTDEVIGVKAEGETAATGIRKEIADAAAGAVSDAKDYTDAREVEINKTTAALAAKDAELEGAIGDNADAISDVADDLAQELLDRAAADKAITDSIGTIAEGKTVVKMIEDAQAAAEANAATAAQGKVDALANGAVATNASEIERVEDKFDEAVADLQEIDTDHEGRIAAMEAFFEGAARDEGEGENLKQALDTLKEIQEFATGEGTAATEMLDAIDANAKAIKAVEDIVKDGGTLEVRVDQAEADVSANAEAIEALQGRATAVEGRATALEGRADAVEGEVDTLNDIVDGYTAKGAIKAAVDAAKEQADKGVADADAALKHSQGVAADLAELTGDDGRIAAAEGKITDLEAVVISGDDSNANLRSAITDLQTLTGDAAKGNEALHTELTRVAGLVDDTKTGLAATKAIADQNAKDIVDHETRIAAIEGDYLKAADVYVFNCGSSKSVVHEQPEA